MFDESSGLKKERKKVLKSALSMSFGTFASRVLGLFRDVAMGALFDRIVTDAWSAAFRLPNLFRRIFGEGALSVSLIPVFLEVKDEDATGLKAQNLINAVYTLLLIFVGGVSLLSFIYIEELFNLMLSSEFVADAARWELTLRFGRIMFGFVVFVTNFAFYMGILNALGSFGLPAAAPMLFNVSMLAFTFMPPQWFPVRGDNLAWGVLVGGFLQSFVLWMTLGRTSYLPRLTWKMFNPKALLVFKKSLPGVIGLGVLPFTTVINLYYASGLEQGAVSYIYWADRLLELPLALVSVSIGAALLPTLSQFVVQKDVASFRKSAEESLLMNLYFSLPCALGLFFLAEPIVEVLFYRGKFTLEDLQMTATVVGVYSLSVVAISCIRVLAPLYFAVQNTMIPMVGSLLGLGLHIILAPIFVEQAGIAGLMYSTALMSIANMLFLFALNRRYTLGLGFDRFMSSVFKFLLSGAAMVLVTQSYFYFAGEKGSAFNVLILFLVIATSGLVYVGVSWLLNTPEAFKIRRLLRL